MLTLLAATFFSSGFGLVLRDAMRRGCNPWAVGVVNYIAATAIQLTRHAASGDPWQIAGLTLTTGSITGVLYAVNYALFVPLLGRRGVSIPSAMSRLAVIFPILASLLLWGERLTPLQATGAVLSLAAMPMLTLRPRQPGAAPEGYSSTWLLLALLLGNGASMVLTKAFRRADLPGQEALYLAVLFGVAILVAGVLWSRHRAGTSARDILPGVALGATNALANWGLVSALGSLPAVLVFPFFSAVGLVFSAVLARLLFGERIAALERGGIVVAIAAVTLANLG